MEKEFVTYEQALALKELGFDDECLKLWKNITLFTLLVNPEEFKRVVSDLFTPAPLKQQVFRWFRDKYDLFISITHYGNGYSINDLRRFDTYEEAENACIDKLIELVK